MVNNKPEEHTSRPSTQSNFLRVSQTAQGKNQFFLCSAKHCLVHQFILTNKVELIKSLEFTSLKIIVIILFTLSEKKKPPNMLEHHPKLNKHNQLNQLNLHHPKLNKHNQLNLHHPKLNKHNLINYLILIFFPLNINQWWTL